MTLNRRRFAKLHELPVGALRPEGWLKRFLQNQRNGLTGHLDTTAFPFNTPGWGTRKVAHETGHSWWPYEQTAYWLDGMIRCGHLLGDKALVRKALRQIDYAVAHADRDGYIGPRHIKEPVHQNRWPHAVFFRAAMAHAEVTGDRRYAEAMRKHYLSKSSPHTNNREVCNVEAMLWAYDWTGDRRLLVHALNAFRRFKDEMKPHVLTVPALLSRRRAHSHGVSFMEIGKIPAILYLYTGNRRWLRAAEAVFKKLDRDHMLVDGVPSSAEFLMGRSPLDGHETCVIADYTWSAGYLLMATGDASYADRIERACFNAAPGAVTSDFKALQYLSSPNQVIAANNTNHHGFGCGDQLMSYRPNPGVQCCPGNVNRMMPNFAARQWMVDGRGGLAAVLYGPCRVTARVGRKQHPLTITEETNYPFSNQIDFRIRTKSPVRFTLTLRVPGWCKRPQIQVNGKSHATEPDDGGWIRIDRTFESGDVVTLRLPMATKLVKWPGGGVAIERGPLVYALRIGERWKIRPYDERSNARLPAYDLHPTTPWNYALETKNGVRDIVVRERRMTDNPWALKNAPIELIVPARRVRGWKLVHRKRVKRGYPWWKMDAIRGDFVFTPPLPGGGKVSPRACGRRKKVVLVPYGCARLRVTVFPEVTGS